MFTANKVTNEKISITKAIAVALEYSKAWNSPMMIKGAISVLKGVLPAMKITILKLGIILFLFFFISTSKKH